MPGKGSSPEGHQALEWVPLGTGHGTELREFKESVYSFLRYMGGILNETSQNHDTM